MSKVPVTYKRTDLQSDQEVKWCPGCGDYTILASVQSFMAEMGISKEKIVFVSGIGCAARFPYYMNTYGLHTIHGRAPAVATGVTVSNPDLSVWVVSGDGDALSIGGNHLIHALRKNVNIKILMFNNQIYGLTKGQYSPTSEEGKKTKSSPFGSVELPFNPMSIALGAEASFVARSVDMDRELTAQVLQEASTHKGRMVNHIYSGGSDQRDRRIDGINRVLSKAVTLAPGINFTTEGSTHREAGKFVALFNDNTDQYSAADKLLVGDWLITNINHVFLLNQNQYLNDITCVKPYTSNPLVEDE